MELSPIIPQVLLNSDDNNELEKYWELLKDDVVEAVRSAFDSFVMPKARSSVLVNGSPSHEFSIKRGLRQDDPLSPFLFIIVMEGLHLALKDAVDTSLLRGTNMGDTSYNISHLFYADDVVIIFDWNKQDMDNIIRVLQVFCLTSGLKLNISKSHVYGLGVSSNDIEDMARDTGCITGNIPFSYLGLLIGSNMNSIDN
ncbi:putative RNA-directed DNA polymerase, eukaryota, reverse transcriptase zinc-binding domain protein [Tanacetum coccineum]